MAFTDADLHSAVAKLAAGFTNAELEALTDCLSEPDDDVAGFGWKPGGDGRQGYLLQRIEAHPGFKPPRLGITSPGDVPGIILLEEQESI